MRAPLKATGHDIGEPFVTEFKCVVHRKFGDEQECAGRVVSCSS